jgi:spore coat protein U domain-containing protein, fimbrial subunit CupE1/2/3/6
VALVCAALAASSSVLADSCTVSATTLAFGGYDTINALNGTSTITVTCTHTNNPAVRFDYLVALSSGPGSYASRQMTGTGDSLIYNLYTSAAMTTVWGDGITAGTATVAGSFVVGGGSGRSGSDTQTVYGRIGAAQNVLPGAYSTATPITVTITY